MMSLPMTRLPIKRFPDRTLPAQLVRTAGRVGGKPFLHYFDPALPEAPPRLVSYAAFRGLTARAATFLAAAGLAPGERVLLLAENSPEWLAVSLATQALRAEPAGLFSVLSAEACESIARRVRPRVIYVSTEAQWRKLAPAAAELVAAGLRAVLSHQPLPPGALPPGLSAATVAGVLGEGATPLADFDARAAAVREDDPFLLLFTSGTTGRQKGVRLAQRTIVAAIDCGVAGVRTTEDDLGLHLLPFGHVAGHDQLCLAMAQGHSLAMIARREDLPRALALSPTYVFSVPLVYERIRLQALQSIERMPAPLRRLLSAGLEAGARVAVDGSRALLDRSLASVASALVGGKIRRGLGGRVRGLFSGGAPAAAALFRFFEGLGMPFVELYGMTETAGLVSMNPFAGPRRAGSVGFITPDHEVRLDANGELQVRGPLLLTSYLEPEDNDGAFTPDGYYRTGDLARIDPDGSLWITGRKKHLMVLSTGKKIAPEPIELAIASTAPFQGAVLLGEGRPYVAAAVFVAQEDLARLATAGRETAEALLASLRSTLAGFSEHEKPKKLIVVAGAPTDYPELVTPTLKVKRDAAIAFLGAKVAALYAS
jgi:long-chain acyl-CoA synthetase